MKALILIATLALGACGSGEREVPSTGGEVCVDFGEVLCPKLDDCGVNVGTFNACVSDIRAACCGDDGTCSDPVTSGLTKAEWNNCLDDIEIASCNDIESGDFPPSCQRL